MTDLHRDIMNISCHQDRPFYDQVTAGAYRAGHRDARHAAAELALSAQRRLEAADALEGALRAILKLHEAHHNDPLHAQARERLAAYEAATAEGGEG